MQLLRFTATFYYYSFKIVNLHSYLLSAVISCNPSYLPGSGEKAKTQFKTSLQEVQQIPRPVYDSRSHLNGDGGLSGSITGQRHRPVSCIFAMWMPEGAGGLSALYLPWGQRHGAPEVKGGEGASNHTLKLESCVERLWGIQDDTILKKYLHTVRELTILWTRANLYHTEINKAPHHCSGVGLTSLFMLSLTRSLILVKQITL